MQKLIYETKFDLHDHELIGGTRFHVNGFAQRLQRFDTEAKGNLEMAWYEHNMDSIKDVHCKPTPSQSLMEKPWEHWFTWSCICTQAYEWMDGQTNNHVANF